ncbi:hypothetical protein ACX9MO_01240 [Pseudooceanicola sp. 502str34]|uniref:hypothetical protein n=1 Tax=Maritimibacter alkaliphilus TaxID=404236 RepID=UPI001C964265|nr:hypothetical protein [Maritimibacter alkaliphilus]MBY6092720.1 hypothetical protein [Maritimibacter alkaliphilus]
MTTRVILAAFLTLVSGGAAFATCPYEHERQAQSCAEGYVWDGSQGACIRQVTG